MRYSFDSEYMGVAEIINGWDPISLFPYAPDCKLPAVPAGKILLGFPLYLDTPYIVKILWGTTTWPDGTGEGTSLHEWFQANGEISQIQVFLDDVIPHSLLAISATNL